jgi:hypothetical protein
MKRVLTLLIVALFVVYCPASMAQGPHSLAGEWTAETTKGIPERMARFKMTIVEGTINHYQGDIEIEIYTSNTREICTSELTEIDFVDPPGYIFITVGNGDCGTGKGDGRMSITESDEAQIRLRLDNGKFGTYWSQWGPIILYLNRNP